MFKQLLRCSTLVVVCVLMLTGISYAADVQITLKGNGAGSVIHVDSIKFSLDGTPLPPAYAIGLSITGNEVKIVGQRSVPDFNDFCIYYRVGAGPNASFCVNTATYADYKVFVFSTPATVQINKTPQVPSLTPYGLMLLVLLLAGSAVWVMRRRSAVQAI